MTSIAASSDRFPDVMLVGRFPAELQSYIDLAIGISANPKDTKAAKQLSEFLVSAEVDGTLAAKGIERR
ncbi:ABC-type molybdate transport system substrate-binding protein [Sinorhizobium terangae]|nr:ABC-type molybdate transport system substrate-binding protein [Sinorhizobium terangae]